MSVFSKGTINSGKVGGGAWQRVRKIACSWESYFKAIFTWCQEATSHSKASPCAQSTPLAEHFCSLWSQINHCVLSCKYWRLKGKNSGEKPNTLHKNLQSPPSSSWDMGKHFPC